MKKACYINRNQWLRLLFSAGSFDGRVRFIVLEVINLSNYCRSKLNSFRLAPNLNRECFEGMYEMRRNQIKSLDNTCIISDSFDVVIHNICSLSFDIVFESALTLTKEITEACKVLSSFS